MNGSAGKNGLEALLPLRRKVTCKRTRPIVQPVVLKRASLGRTLMAKPREASAIWFGISGYRMSQSFVKRDATPRKLSAAPTNHYRIELKLSLGQVLIKCE